MNTIRVVAAVFEENGKFFVAQRPLKSHLGGEWEFPGGKVENGESDIDALQREIYEELGVTISVGEKIGEVTHNYPERVVNLNFYSCVKTAGEIILHEHNDMTWLNKEELLSIGLASGDLTFVSHFLSI